MGESVRAPKAVGDVIEQLVKLLSRWAKRPSPLPGNVHQGVRVRYSTKRRNIVRFELVTKDDIRVAIDFDFNQLSRDYIDGMVAEVREQVYHFRKHRQERDRIVLPAGVTLQ